MGVVARRYAAAAVLAIALGACGDGGGGPPAVNVTGTYNATFFTVTPVGGAAIDVLLAPGGGSLTITLNANLTTSGTLVVPASRQPPSPPPVNINASMAGTYTVAGGVVNFDQAANTFMKDLPFSVQGGTLVGSATFGTNIINVVLSK